MKRSVILSLALLFTLTGCIADSNNSGELSQTIPTVVYSTTTSATESTVQTEITEDTTNISTSPETSEPDEIESGTAVIAFAGDTTQSDIFNETTSLHSIEYPFEDVAPIFREADISFVNLETCVSERGQSEKNEGYGFRTPPQFLEVYTTAGIDIVSCANNHARDYGMDALADTFGNLDKYGIDYIGAGSDIDAAKKLVTYEINGIKIGFTACNMINHNSTWYATDERAGLVCVDYGDHQWYLDLISEYEKQCDVLFVSVHWGIEYLYDITAEQQEFGHQLCDSGADIILGHHPHVLEPIEHYNGKMIFYSLGNFLFYKMDDYAGQTAIFEIEIDKNGFISGRLSPVFITYCKSKLLDSDSEMYAEIIELCDRISEPYGVSVNESGEIELI